VHAPAVVPSQADQLSARVRHFAIRILRFVRTLARDPTTDGIARQIARSAPSVWANYRSSRRARSRAEFIARLGIVADEAEETEGWLDMLKDAGLAAGQELEWLLNESREIRAIFVQSAATARANQRAARSSNS